MDTASGSLRVTSQLRRVGIVMLDTGIEQLPDSAALYIARGILYAGLGGRGGRQRLRAHQSARSITEFWV